MPDNAGETLSSFLARSLVEPSDTSRDPSEFSRILSLMFLSAPVTIENRWYNSQEISLDGFTFIRCRFDNCKFIVGRGAFKFEHCVVAGGSALYSEEAGRIVRLYSQPAGQKSDLSRESLLRPVWHEDGTLSIG
jgi:hypothetical protein